MTAQLEIAWTQAEAGIRQSADHAESCEPGFGEAALQALKNYAAMADEFTAFDFRQYLKSIGFSVEVPKGLGATFKRAAALGYIRADGTRPHPERHCSPTTLWRSLRQVARAA